MSLRLLCSALFVAGLALGSGCRKNAIDQALESDANGYVCGKCNARFYTAREVFPIHCPQCKEKDILQVVSYICAADKHATVSPRGRAGMPCEKCGKPTAGMGIPREVDLKAWGAAKRSGPEIGVN